MQATGSVTRRLRGPEHASYVDRHTQTTGTGKTSYGDRSTHTARTRTRWFTQDTLTMAGVYNTQALETLPLKPVTVLTEAD